MPLPRQPQWVLAGVDVVHPGGVFRDDVVQVVLVLGWRVEKNSNEVML